MGGIFVKKKSIIIHVFVVMVIFAVINCVTFSRPIIASESIKREKIIISISIKEGDTLWSIASEYYTSDYKDMNEFIDAIKHCNGISEQIKIGQKILIPCYRKYL